MPQPVCRGEKTTSRNRFSLSILWVPGFELRLSDLSTRTLPTEPSGWLLVIYLFFYMYVLPVCMVSLGGLAPQGSQKKASDLLELELQMCVSHHHVGARSPNPGPLED